MPKHPLLFLIALALIPSSTSAQNSNHMGIPAESKPGQSTPSSYTRDKIETVNLANGNFSLSIPLATVGGRGSVSYTIALSYNSKVWSAQRDREAVFLENGALGSPLNHYSAMYEKEFNDYDPGVTKLGGGWTIRVAPGIKGKVFGIDPMPVSGCHNLTDDIKDCGFRYALTKMWLSLPDGSQVELRDSLTQGAPALTTHIQDGYHLLIDRERGRVWRSTDGSNVIFIRDANDPIWPDLENFTPSGWVYLADGSRMRMDLGMGSKLIDRNGNFITLGPTYTDQLGRQTLVQVLGSTVSVTVKGYLGTPDRSVTVNTGAIGDPENLRADFRSLPRPFTTGDAYRDTQGNFFEHTIQSPHTDLFIESEGVKAYGTLAGDDVGARTAVTRLNLLDGRSFRFRYNQYGEVAEIVYPAGGVSQIDYSGGVTSICEVSAPVHLTLNRRVSTRRTLTDGLNVDATWLYSLVGAEVSGTSYSAVIVAAYPGQATTGLPLSSEKHLFLKLGFGAEYRSCFGQYTGTGNEKWQSAKEFRTETQTGSGTVVTVRNWEQRTPVVWANDEGLGYNAYVNQADHAQDQPPNDDRVSWEETTLEDGKTKRVEYGYDNFNNVTSIKEYDFGTPGAPGNLLRQTFRNYATTLNGYCYANLNPGDSSCGNGLAADVTSVIYQPRLLLSETVKDAAGNQKAHSQFEYDNYIADINHAAIVPNNGMIQYDGSQFATFSNSTQPRGNVTKTTRWLNGGADIVSYSRYDNAGQVISSKDANGNISFMSYADNFGPGVNPDPSAGVTGPAGPTFAMASTATNPLGHQVKVQYDYSLGAVTGVKDVNGVITKTEYDSLGRPFRVTSALGLAEQSISQMSYPTAQENAARVSNQLDSTRWLASKTDFDGFDRPITSWRAEDGQHASLANFIIRIDSIYDPIGRVKQVSNPYRPATESPILTTTAYDLAGRVVSVTTPDAAVVATSYSSNTVTVTDQAQKKRRSVTDALGRLKEIYEDPNGLNYLTSYGYDSLDNLTSISQGIQTRTFVYDSLKRLTSATNPESGTITYQYDANGNLTQKTDARGVVTVYRYDALNRNTTVDYSDTSGINPDITHIYDTANNGKGRLRESYSGGSETVGATVESTKIQSYDAMGRPLDQRRRFKTNNVWNAEFQIQRAYNLAGGVTSQTYPSGHTVTYSYDGAGHASSFIGNLGDGVGRPYSAAIIYSSLGGITKEQFGTDTPLYNKSFYNSRGQLSEIRVGTTYTGPSDTSWNRGAIINHYSNNCWGMCGGSNSTTSMTDNNGNLKKQEVYIPNNEQLPTTGYKTWWQVYDYDNLNRLQRVHEYTGNTQLDWQQEYVYDRYGNRTIHQTNTYGAGINKKDFTANAANNRLGVPAGQTGTMAYDNAGNLTTDTYSAAAVSRTYDAKNRITSETQANNFVAGVYTYNAEGERVRRKVSGVETWQVYGLDGELLAEYAAGAPAGLPQKEYGYRNGQLLITAAPAAGERVNFARVNSPYAYATASSSFSLSFTPNATNNGDRKGLHWGFSPLTGSGWQDATDNTYPDWLQIDFNTNRTIDEIDVFTIQDNWMDPVEPTESMTFGTQGITNFDVQYWSGTAWLTVPGGSVTGNNKVWRKLTFAAITTSKIRVLVNASQANYSRILELEAWGNTAGSAFDLKWLVTDQLGTPRIVFDKTGALATAKRHDYLPFGEELSAMQGARSTTLGYGASDGVRQKFANYERDNETSLDFAEARYYSSAQGRFTSSDPYVIFFEMEAGRNARERSQILRAYISEPQNWNRYSYCLNDPVNLIDPSGLVWLTKDHENFRWVDDEKYKAEDWKGYEVVEAGTVAYFGEGWGGYEEKYKGLLGTYVTLNADGSLTSAGMEPTDAPVLGEYHSYNEGIGNFGLGMIVQNNEIHPTLQIAPSWPAFSLSHTTGQGQVSPGVYGQLTTGNYGLVVNESVNLLHPTSGFSRETGYGTPQVSAGIQVVFPAVNGMTERDWLHHPDNPLGKGPVGRAGGRCPY
ncbi:MAG TPA: RHS repeat-associated core domain-containing protein [Pyrinomonadaceae bacterium]